MAPLLTGLVTIDEHNLSEHLFLQLQSEAIKAHSGDPENQSENIKFLAKLKTLCRYDLYAGQIVPCIWPHCLLNIEMFLYQLVNSHSSEPPSVL